MQIDADAEEEAKQNAPVSRTTSIDPFQTQSDNLQKRIERIKQLKYQEVNRVVELTKKQLDRTMQRLSKQRETTFQDNFDALQRGLTGREGIVAQVNGTLEQAAAVKHDKKTQLFSEWDEQVGRRCLSHKGLLALA